MKKAIGAIVFLAGCVIGAAERADIWPNLPLSGTIAILLVAVTVCSIGVSLWKSG